jgi:hypothetical protein
MKPLLLAFTSLTSFTSFVSFVSLLMAGVVFAAGAPALSPETLDDIAKHETIAAAHTEAAKCLRSGKSDEVCEGALQKACKGVAIGKFCGMKH